MKIAIMEGARNRMLKKRFNITGLCVPERHYMMNLDERLKEIRKMVDDGAYFVINHARQYGKTINKKKQVGMHEIVIGDKVLVEAVA